MKIPNRYWLQLLVMPVDNRAGEGTKDRRGVEQESHTNTEEGYGPGNLTTTGYRRFGEVIGLMDTPDYFDLF